MSGTANIRGRWPGKLCILACEEGDLVCSMYAMRCLFSTRSTGEGRTKGKVTAMALLYSVLLDMRWSGDGRL